VQSCPSVPARFSRSPTIPEKTVALNRRARHEFTIEDTLEAGLVLTGTEIKSIRAGKVNLADAYARIERDEAWLIGAHIAPFEQGNRYNHEPKRIRKLLLRRSEIDELLGKTKAKGLTLVPLRLYLTGKGRAKDRAGARPAASRPMTAAGTSPIATPAATWPASSPTSSAGAEDHRAQLRESTAPPAAWRSIRAVDLHACGEPGRVIVGRASRPCPARRCSRR
jgi:SsrA-binding protein